MVNLNRTEVLETKESSLQLLAPAFAGLDPFRGRLSWGNSST